MQLIRSTHLKMVTSSTARPQVHTDAFFGRDLCGLHLECPLGVVSPCCPLELCVKLTLLGYCSWVCVRRKQTKVASFQSLDFLKQLP